MYLLFSSSPKDVTDDYQNKKENDPLVRIYSLFAFIMYI